MPCSLLHSLLSPCIWGRSAQLQFANLSMPFQNTGPLDIHESAKELLNSRYLAFQVGVRQSLQPSVFWQSRMSSVSVVIFSSPKCTSCVSDGEILVTAFKRSIKYSVHLPRMSSSLLSKTTIWPLMDLVVWDLLLQRCWMVCQNTPLVCQLLESSLYLKCFQDCIDLFCSEVCGLSRLSIM